ncbi:MAG TPA: Rrf2 family transcriptional regulator [Rhodopila sp.]|uniref:RrF2 family transcriptional regulator n=1 Tax=Rhodopila sp. TaxID=2480087 RepID=UPI002C9DC83E|nr:Rrf2 family transcriptional regulator [Rhodopila sp.]HVY13999.1 Rrf2 family transcriptional regulator [Rhodopila sp.]
MRLTRYTDYAIRTALYLASHPERLCSIGEIARAYDISQNHLMKVVSDLAAAGYVQSLRGRGGGIRLALDPAEINLGALIRHTEGNLDLVGCATCAMAPACGMTSIFHKALAAFLAVLDGYTLADVTTPADVTRLQMIFEALTPRQNIPVS